ncbi:DUF4440 domain-containing protein [Yoonia sp. BS5-3]|uniref:DUF4440 domain-containing protein n=1 Tax=Yoonia phaeophyticola TaxID=3137369 RepID=A0ABZ2V2R0_9RHOB
MLSPDALLSTLTDLETGVWQALVDGDAAADAASLDDGFLGVYCDGFAGKSDHVRQLDGGPTIVFFSLSQHHVLPLGDAHTVLSYRADFTRVGSDAAEAMYVSSIWKVSGQSWVNVFSQDTAVIL